jgi:hypothetical protein
MLAMDPHAWQHGTGREIVQADGRLTLRARKLSQGERDHGVLMDNCLPGDIMAVGAAGATASPAVPLRPGRRLMAAMLLIAAALDLTRCGLVLTAARYLMPTAGLVAAGLAAAGLTLRTARDARPASAGPAGPPR